MGKINHAYKSLQKQIAKLKLILKFLTMICSSGFCVLIFSEFQVVCPRILGVLSAVYGYKGSSDVTGFCEKI